MTVTSFVWLLNVIVFIVCENGRYVPIVNVRTGFDVILRGDYHSQTNMTWRQYMCNDTAEDTIIRPEAANRTHFNVTTIVLTIRNTTAADNGCYQFKAITSTLILLVNYVVTVIGKYL